MDTQDGFIVGVYNYCDRWCERCALAGRCRVFAEEQRLSFELPAAPGEHPASGHGHTPVLRSLGAVAAAFEELPDEPLYLPVPEHADRRTAWPDLPPAEADLHARVRALADRLSVWLAPECRAQEAGIKDAVEVLQHFAIFVGPKVYRALRGRDDEEWQAADSDANGSAKAALLAFDRLGEAWLRLAEQGAISVLEAGPVLTALPQLTAEIERLFPRARDFVRPGFDEPAALAILEWRERG